MSEPSTPEIHIGTWVKRRRAPEPEFIAVVTDIVIVGGDTAVTVAGHDGPGRMSIIWPSHGDAIEVAYP